MSACAADQGESLDLHEGISHPGKKGCSRWPKNFRLKGSDGRLIPGRCHSSNLCAYCARLAAVENSEVLALDALETGGPAVWAVLTTRSAVPNPEPFYNARRLVMRALKRRWPDAEYAALVEFTTGYGPKSGGRRRPHWNLLLKGIPASDVSELKQVIARVWCQHVDATPAGQFVGSVHESGGLMRYLALHFQKESQAPPHGWRGHRFIKSRGYFLEPMPAMRARAREQLQYRRDIWKYEQSAAAAGVELLPGELHELAEARRDHRAGVTWQLVQAPEETPLDRSWADLQIFLGVRPQGRERPPECALDMAGASRPSGVAAPHAPDAGQPVASRCT